MTARALAVFSVSHRNMKLRVRVLPQTQDVDSAYRGGKRRRGGGWVHAYFVPALRADAIFGGIITLPADGRLAELVPHEVLHAALHRLGTVDRADDEPLAEAVGLLTARILDRLARLGIYGVGHEHDC